MTDTTALTPAQQRLEAARAEAAALAARKAAAETTSTTEGPRVAEVGERVHFLASGFSVPQSLPDELWGGPGNLQMTRGDELVITERHRDAARNRFGEPGWLGLVYDADEQRRRYGRVVVAPGPRPAGMESWVVGDRDWALARENAMLAAGAIGDAYERQAAIKAVQDRFGAPWNPHVGTVTYSGDDGDAAVRR
ncbi:hypothetical protein [Microbacterium sp. SL75]|uniref:hypothetical protein n=1 Tax=Microbacterium sp. SL75 TaxID=2995140 RepID=UPI00226FC2B0|nr:hypothetical protein [Microbacterium sp. SL75]WAC68552.1 hypothetical protein OVA17_13255 [Microbacterium sp. SL75]